MAEQTKPGLSDLRTLLENFIQKAELLCFGRRDIELGLNDIAEMFGGGE